MEMPFVVVQLIVQHRQFGEALHDALHLWITGNANLGDVPMMQQMVAWRDELYRTFMEPHA